MNLKLCFSTVGCPDWSFDEIFGTARDLNLAGVEIRGVGDEIYAPSIPAFLDENIDKTLAKLKKYGVCIPVLASNSALAAANARRDFEDAKKYIDLAAQIGAPYIRVMSTSNPYPEEGDLTLCRELYAALCEYGASKGVTPLIETNGLLADSACMRGFVDGIQNSGVLWDIHHTWRFFNETPEQTAAELAGLVRHVHIKDSVMKNGEVSYRMLGYGDVPLLDCLRALIGGGYDGFVSLEWVKRWNPGLEEPGVVFSHFAGYMGYMNDLL